MHGAVSAHNTVAVLVNVLRFSAWEIAGQTSNLGSGSGIPMYVFRKLIDKAIVTYIDPSYHMTFFAAEATRVLGTMIAMRVFYNKIDLKTLVATQLKGAVLDIGACLAVLGIIELLGIDIFGSN